MKKIIFIILCFPLIAFAHSGDTFEIKMNDANFEPASLEISQGDTVIFKNIGKNKHWPASDIHPTHQIYPKFDPKQGIAPGESWSFQFKKAGSWRMHDHLNAQVTGKIIAKADANFKDSEKSAEQKPKLAKRLADYFKNFYLRTYYRIFSSKRAALLQGNMLETAKNEDKLKFLLQMLGPKPVMNQLLKDSGNGSTVDCHQQAHQVGRIAYELYGAKAFSEGDASCHSGFYHGAMEAFLKEKGTDDLAPKISALCKKFETQFGNFECLHGVGHGVLAYEDYNLPEALATCQKLNTDYEKNSCYGGLFMENIVTGQGLGAKPDHKTEWLNKDPHFPCKNIGDDFNMRYQCYQMQTSWMLWLFNYDFDRVIKECLNAPEDMRPVCYKSVGRDAAGNSLRNPVTMKEICNKVPNLKDYKAQCVVGGINVIVDFWGGRLEHQASAFCRILPSENKLPCYQTLSQRLLDIFAEPEQRKPICYGFEKEYQNLCLQ